MNDIDFYEWRAAKYGYEYKTGDDLDELDELLADCRSPIQEIERPNPDAEQEELERLQAEREELDRLLTEQEEHDLQLKLEDREELDRDLATLDELLTPGTERGNRLGGDFPQTEPEAEQRRFSANDQTDRSISLADQAITRKNARLATPKSGDFPQEPPKKSASKKRCTPGLAGVLTVLYHAHEYTLAVLGELQTLSDSSTGSLDTKTKDEISRRATALEFQKSLALSTANGVDLPDWERRLSPDTKRAFALLAISQHPDAKSITFRLGHEVAEAALRAKKSPTDYLARLLQRLGITQAVFALECSTSASDENNPHHIHGVAIIPADLLDELTSKLRAALAPPPCSDATPPVRGYRQRYSNKAIDIRPVRTAGGWFQYITKEIDFTAHALNARPDYASRSASKAGKELYETIRAWIYT